MLPDLLVIGDSHSNALLAGCRAHGLTAEMLRFSGNFWHSGHVVFHREHGIWVRRIAAQQQLVIDLRARLGGRSVIGPDVPILATMGYHLGRIVPPFGTNNHVSDAESFADDPTSHYASVALVDAYVEQTRASHIQLARRMSRHGNMTLVAPPKVFGRSNYHAVADAVSRRMRAAGVRLYDPSEDLFAGGEALASDYLSEDGVHGNDRYGAEVVGRLIAHGLIAKRAA